VDIEGNQEVCGSRLVDLLHVDRHGDAHSLQKRVQIEQQRQKQHNLSTLQNKTAELR
jgi:hypothetical protein